MGTVNDGAARVLRGGIWLGSAETIIQFLEAFFVEFNEAQHVASLAMLTLAINTVVVVVEHFKQRGLFLRNVPPNEVEVAGA